MKYNYPANGWSIATTENALHLREKMETFTAHEKTAIKYFNILFLGEIPTIEKRNDQYYVVSEKSERNLGAPYKTREEAEKRLRQVEYFKHMKS